MRVAAAEVPSHLPLGVNPLNLWPGQSQKCRGSRDYERGDELAR